MEYNDDPLFRYSDEELRKMTREEFCAILEERNDYINKKRNQINEEITPKFNSIEEIMDYYDCITFEEAINNLNKLLEK